jgi:hypothetical protein
LEDSVIPHRNFHRWLFAVAGAYNIGWGVVTAIDPQWLFRFARMPLANYPQVFVCLGMVIGVYGLLYWTVAFAPEHGWQIVGVGLLGKILGAIGLAVLVVNGTWPIRTIVLCVPNDLIWMAPFGFYLRDFLAYQRSGR